MPVPITRTGKWSRFLMDGTPDILVGVWSVPAAARVPTVMTCNAPAVRGRLFSAKSWRCRIDVNNFARALIAVKTLKDEGVLTEYALGGAMAIAFWSEPTATYDLNVFVLMESGGLLVDLGPLYDWAGRHEYPLEPGIF
jgi:hypothetical protein